jgi:hypothetical protein
MQAGLATCVIIHRVRVGLGTNIPQVILSNNRLQASENWRQLVTTDAYACRGRALVHEACVRAVDGLGCTGGCLGGGWQCLAETESAGGERSMWCGIGQGTTAL